VASLLLNWRGRREWARVKAELAAKGESVDYDSFLKPPVPDVENVMAHPYIKKHFVEGTPIAPFLYPNTPSELTALQKLPRQTEQRSSVETQKLDPSSLQGILDGYSRYRSEFASLEEALQRPQSRLNRDPREFVWPRLMPNANFKSFPRAAETYERLCKIHLLLGHADIAMKDLRMLRQLTEATPCTEPPTVVSSMWKVGLAKIYANTLEETLAAELWPNPYLAEVQMLCQGVDLLSNFTRSMRGERAVGLRGVQSLDKGLSDPNGALWLIMAAIPNGWIDLEFANYARLFQFLLEGVDVTRQRLDANAIDAGDKFIRKSTDNGLGLHGELAYVALPISRRHQTTAINQTLLNQASMACGLERYRAANGAYPETLEVLVPQFASKFPHDLFDGQPLRYRRTDDGRYLLYSIGWNSKDDGGKMESPKEGQSKTQWSDDKGDWVWQGVPKR